MALGEPNKNALSAELAVANCHDQHGDLTGKHERVAPQCPKPPAATVRFGHRKRRVGRDVHRRTRNIATFDVHVRRWTSSSLHIERMYSVKYGDSRAAIISVRSTSMLISWMARIRAGR